MHNYYDAAATTPTHPLVLEAMLPYFTDVYGNPSSNHGLGKMARAAVETAREQVADLLNVFPDEVIFTSGATEAINLGILGYWMANRSKGNHIITVVTEHAAVLNTCAHLEQFGVEVTRLTVNKYGQIDYEELSQQIRVDTLLVAVMHVNNETGLIHDVERIAKICSEKATAFFTDATQSVGHIEVDYSTAEITAASISAHKIQGPKGIGALILKRGAEIAPLTFGGGQERGLRPGSLATPLIVGLGKIAHLTAKNLPAIKSSLSAKSSALLTELNKLNELDEIIPCNLRAPHILPVIAKSKSNEEFLKQKHIQDRYAVSTSSACKSGIYASSHVVTSMLNAEKANRFIRFSIMHDGF